MEHTISVLVENHVGVLARIAGLFSARGFNITSLSVGETEDPEVSRMTIVVDADERILEQIKKQLNKLIDTRKVIDLTGQDYVERELILIKVKKEDNFSELLELVDVFRGKILDVSHDSITIELTGSTSKIEAFINLILPFGILEMARTGRVALGRGEKNSRRTL